MESALQWVAHILKLCHAISHKSSLFLCLFLPNVNPTLLARLQSEIISIKFRYIFRKQNMFQMEFEGLHVM
jgi:hypothetical protein